MNCRELLKSKILRYAPFLCQKHKASYSDLKVFALTLRAKNMSIKVMRIDCFIAIKVYLCSTINTK
jgi:hypothetical protein